MRTLKDQILLDRAVFLNPKEFGDEMSVDGVSCLGLWTEEQDQPVKQFFGQGWDQVFGAFTVERVLYVMRRDGADMDVPVPTQELEIDGKIWTVRDASVDGGIVKAIVYRNES